MTRCRDDRSSSGEGSDSPLATQHRPKKIPRTKGSGMKSAIDLIVSGVRQGTLSMSSSSSPQKIQDAHREANLGLKGGMGVKKAKTARSRSIKKDKVSNSHALPLDDV